MPHDNSLHSDADTKHCSVSYHLPTIVAVATSHRQFFPVKSQDPHSPTTVAIHHNAVRRTDLDTTVTNPDIRGDACVSPPPGRGDESLDGEASPTRGEALEMLGIDLDRVGEMTTARINSRQSLAAPAEESPRTERSRRVRQEAQASNTSDGRQKEENRGRKRNRGGAFATTGRGSESAVAAAAVAKKQEQLTEKLRELNVLLASEPLSSPAVNCIPSRPERNINPGKIMPKSLLPPAGSIEGAIGGCTASANVIHDDAGVDNHSCRDESPRRNNQIPANSPRRDGLPRIRTQGVGTKDIVADIDVPESQQASSDVERASEECAQTEAPVIPKLNIDGRGSIETLPPKEDTTLKPDAKGLPNHRQACCI